jgi:hypothetical protein
LGGDEATMTSSDPRRPAASEACAGCGEDTAVGSVFYSDRRAIELKPGSPAFLCTLCDQRIESSRHGTRLTDEELHTALERGSIAMMAAFPDANLPPGG